MCVYDINICKDDEDLNYATLQEALYIGDGGQVTARLGVAHREVPKGPPYRNNLVLLKKQLVLLFLFFVI